MTFYLFAGPRRPLPPLPVNRALFGLLTSVALFPFSGTARAQTSPVPLPGIVVQGATLGTYVTPKPRRERDGDSEPGPQAGQITPATPTPSLAEPGSTGGSAGQGSGGATIAGIDVSNQGSAVTVITREELRQQQVTTVAEALRNQPGVTVSRTGSLAGLTTIGIRGGVGKDTLVLIDGVEANGLSDGSFDFSNLTTDDIERIEIIRGPQSGIYGSSASSGVINIITARGKGPLSVEARGEGGSFGTRDGSVRVSGGSDKFWASGSYSALRSDGFPIAPNGHVDQHSDIRAFSLRAGAEIVKDFTIDLNLRNIEKGGLRGGFGNSGGLYATATDSASFFSSDIWLAGLQGNWSTFGGYWTHKFQVNSNRTRLDDSDISKYGLYYSRNDSEAMRENYATTIRVDTPSLFQSKQFITGFVEHADEKFVVVTDDNARHSRTRLSPAGEWRGEFFDKLFLSGTVRQDYNDDAFADFTTYRSSGSLKVFDTGVRMHASAGTGVKFPSLFQQFGSVPSQFMSNPLVKPEETIGWDAGLEYAFLSGRFLVDATYFDQDLKNEIRTAYNSNFIATVVNDPGRSHREGVEITGRAILTAALSLGSSYTYTDARQSNGLVAIRRPPHSAKVDLNYTFDQKRGNFRLTAAYNGKSEDTAFRNSDFSQSRVTLSDYVLLTAAASYEVQKGVEVFGRIENALNEKYQEVYGYNTAGIAAYAGMRVKLDLVNGTLTSLRE